MADSTSVRTHRRSLPGGLLLRGLVARRGIAVSLLIAATLVSAASALGPTYALGASESLLRDRLTQTPVQMIGTRIFTVYPDTDSPDVPLAQALAFPVQTPVSLPGYGAPVSSISWQTASGQVRSAVVDRPGFCRHLIMTAGRCPNGASEAVVSARSAEIEGIGWTVGTDLTLNDQADGAISRTVRIVGQYEPESTSDPFWFGDDHFGQHTSSDGAITTDDLFVEPDFFPGLALAYSGLAATATVSAAIDYPLSIDAVRLGDVPALLGTLRALPKRLDPSREKISTGLPSVLTANERDRQRLEAGTLVVALQLVFLGLFAMFRLAGDFAEARGPELAIAKLRGRTPWQVLRFGLGEPLVLLAVGAVAGLWLALLAARVLGGQVLVPGTPVVLTSWSALAAFAALLGGLAAISLAGHRVLTRPVTEQWRRTTRVQRRSRVSAGTDVVVAVAALLGFVLLRTLGSSTIGPAALLSPGLLLLAVALLGVRLLPEVLRSLLAPTRASPRVGLLLAVRQIVRRPAGIRLATLLAVAVGLATFGIGAQSAAVGNREALARAETGAPVAIDVQVGTRIDPVAAVRRADPSGRWGMAAATWLPGGGGSIAGTVLAVDPARLSAVAEPVRGGVPATALAVALRSPAARRIEVRGTRLAVGITVEQLDGGGGTVNPQLELRDGLGRPVSVSGRTLQEGAASYGFAIPCSTGCTLTGLSWQRSVLSEGKVSGVALIRSMASSGGASTPIDARLRDPKLWRAAEPVSESRDVVDVSAAGVRDRFSVVSGYGGVTTDPAPGVLRAVGTPRGLFASHGRRGGAIEDDSLNRASFALRAQVPLLPRVLDYGVLMDVGRLRAALPGFGDAADWQVWVGPSAPPDVRERLTRVGLRPQSSTSVEERAAVLARQWPALVLLLLLTAAITAAAIAVVSTAVAVVAASRRRSYELAALRAVGVPQRQLVIAALLENGLLLGTATVLGVPAGIVTGLLALPLIPQFAAPTPMPLLFLPAPLPLLSLVIVFAVLLLLAVLGTAAGQLRASGPERLREVEE